MKPREKVPWRCRDRQLALGEETLIMGVVNVTPDSFSDGGKFFDHYAAVEHARRLVGEGARIIDVGGESSRPGARPVPAEEELRRVMPVVESLVRKGECLVSVDTSKADVARVAMAAGAQILNDISAMTADPEMPSVVLEAGAGVILMHMQGCPQTMQVEPRYGEVVADVCAYLRRRIEELSAQGIDRECLAVDPGIGFGKTLGHNLRLLSHIDAVAAIGRPVLVGLSRKSFLGAVTGKDVEHRLAASLGGLAYAIMQGAHILRVHDVLESCDIARLLDILRQEEERCDSSSE